MSLKEYWPYERDIYSTITQIVVTMTVTFLFLKSYPIKRRIVRKHLAKDSESESKPNVDSTGSEANEPYNGPLWLTDLSYKRLRGLQHVIIESGSSKVDLIGIDSNCVLGLETFERVIETIASVINYSGSVFVDQGVGLFDGSISNQAWTNGSVRQDMLSNNTNIQITFTNGCITIMLILSIQTPGRLEWKSLKSIRSTFASISDIVYTNSVEVCGKMLEVTKTDCNYKSSNTITLMFSKGQLIDKVSEIIEDKSIMSEEELDDDLPELDKVGDSVDERQISSS